MNTDIVLINPFFGRSIEGNTIELQKYGRTGKKILLIGGIHGHPERQSVDFCLRLIQAIRVSSKPLACQLSVIPELNPDSTYVVGVQTNANGIDLNRNFPSKNQHLTDKEGKNKGGEPMSEPETKIVVDQVEDEKPDVIIAIHQKYKCLDYDGPADPVMLVDLSKALDLPIKKLGACNGSMGSFFGEEQGIPVITVEFEYEMSDQRIDDSVAKMVDYLCNNP